MMEVRPDVLAAILAMTVVTYACRAGGYALLRGRRLPACAEAMLRHLPGALFMAYVTPPLVAGSWPAWIGAAAVIGVQLATRNLGVAIIAGIAVVWGAQAVLS
jgi:uncharacterized membrane protein